MNRKILVVDDKQEYLQIAMNYILEEQIPYALLGAKNGKIALEIAKKELPHIIIMDWEMPEMNGIETVKKLKEDELTCDIPVIISTGIRITSADLRIAMDAGASDFIRKPVDKTEFLARISSHLKMVDYITTIKEQNKELDSAEFIRKEGIIDSLHNQVENSKTQIAFFDKFMNEIAARLVEVRSNNKLITNINEELTNIVNSIKTSSKKAKRTNKEICLPNSNFVNALLKENKTLTPQEIQLCFMLKNNLSSKEIAELTFKAETTVRVARSKVRKKLGLNESENLNTYIQKY